MIVPCHRMHRKFVPVHRMGGATLGFVRPTDSGTQAFVITREATGRLVASIPRMVLCGYAKTGRLPEM